MIIFLSWFRVRWCVGLLGLSGMVDLPQGLAQDAMMSASSEESMNVTFEAVMPVFRQHCVSCHNDNQPRGGLSMTSLDKVMAGSASGPVIVPGKPEESLIYLLTAHVESPKMPPNKPRIPQRELKLLEYWIRAGEEFGSESAEPSNSNENKDRPAITLGEPSPLTQRDMVRSLAVHPTKPVVAIGVDGQVLFADMSGKLQDKSLLLPGQEVTSLRFRAGGDELWIASGVPGDSGSLLGWNIPESKPLMKVGNELDTVQAFDVEPAGTRFAIGTTQRLLKILSGGDDTGNEAMELKKHTDWILSVSYSNDGLLVASGDRFGGIQVWNAKTGEVFASLRGHTAAVSSLGWFSDGETLVSGSLDGTIRWWSMNSLEQTASWDAHKGGVTAIAMATDDSLWSTGNDQRVCGWTFADGDRILRSWDLPGKGVALSLGNQARSLAVSDSEGHVYVASLEDVFSGSSSEESKEAGWIQVELPVQPSPRTYAIYSPSPPNRSPLEIKPPKISAPSAIESKPVMGMDSIRKSLEEVEAALEKSRETTTQLERAAEQLRALLQEQESSK
ncbi:MAG: hypothetical protein MUF23_11730 [Pirellula sp.]|nr:hypothetical protein [Pirellula sp.]